MVALSRVTAKRIVLTILLVAVAACGSPIADTGSSQSRGQDPPIDWDNPLPNSRTISSTDEARPFVQFTAREPQGLGTPIRRVMTKPGEDRRGHALGYIYDSSEFGRVVVAFSYSEIPMAQWEEGMRNIADGDEEPGAVGTAEVVSIRGGRFALITTAEDGSRSDIRWREGSTQIVVAGPALTRDACLVIAERV